MVKLIALYKKPDDVSAFDKHYNEVHIPLVEKTSRSAAAGTLEDYGLGDRRSARTFNV